MNILHQTPILEARTSRENAKFWQGFAAELPDGRCVTFRNYWQVNGDGVKSKVQTSAHSLVEGKNIGRANETRPCDQAIFEIKSDEKRQRDKGYADEGTTKVGNVLPMLAHKFNERVADVTYPVYAQHKYDGNRALTDGKTMWSRKGLEFLSPVIAHLIGGTQPAVDVVIPKGTKGQVLLLDIAMPKDKTFPVLDTEGYTLDGEIILPHNTVTGQPTPLQETNSALRKYSAKSHELIYRVYDVVAPDLEYKERYAIAARIVRKANNPNIVLAPVEVANDHDELMAIHERFVSEGWEGSMVRLGGMGYAIGHRSVQLLKLKDFLDDEFKVIGVVEGKGKLAGHAIFTMETKDGKEFECSPVGSLSQREIWFQNPELVIGKIWTVRFQAYTNSGIPQFARAMNERDSALSG